MKRVMIAMSGGVESSVAAALLLKQNYQVCGVTMRLFGDESLALYDQERLSFSREDLENARELAHRCDFKHYVFNFSSAFHGEVVTRLTDGYLKGLNPNPCIFCNRYIKYGELLRRAVLMKMDYLATGTYARIEYDDNRKRWLLKKAAQIQADQSYMLYFLRQEQLSRLLFPLGELSQEEIFKMADELQGVNSQKKDGEYVCFVRDGDYAGFLEKTMGLHPRSGNFTDRDGNVLGEHKGLIHYSVGQRKGIGISFDEPHYVLEKDIFSNTVILGEKKHLYTGGMTLEDVNFISVDKLDKPMEVTVKKRVKGKEYPAMISPLANGKVQLEFKKPQKNVPAGQALVFYDGDTVVGGGTAI
ncbi:MAG: tRNA 2-thiouridine(34) synthase MnmA [Oscillospiraceae bacterium]|nr:tRNA 2-thiouridine(34) synthase MnmA [Oscillospiraceae bacterium]